MSTLPYTVSTEPMITLPAEGWPLDAFRQWVLSDEFPNHIRASYLVDHVVIDMSPEQPETHIKVKGQLYAALEEIVRKSELGSLYTDGVLFTNETAKISTVPDAVFVSTEALRSGRVRWLPSKKHPEHDLELTGTPDWILEVVSPSSKRKDTRDLRKAYNAAGVPEYWIVDALGETIRFQILIHTPGGYVEAPVDGEWQPSRVFRRDFRLRRSRGSDELWRYDLEARESSPPRN